VEKVRTADELAAPARGSDPEIALFRNGFRADRSPDFFVQRRPYVLDSRGRGTDHESHHDYDRKVPLVFFGPGVAARTIREPVATVDLAPTLASLLGVAPPPDLDGVDRSAFVRE
jgi:predicted AlkP superfamily pyrophosphatase or phosphodiesterase